MSEFNGKKFYGFSLHNDPALSTSTRNFEFKYTRPEQLERAIQKVHLSDHDRSRKQCPLNKYLKPKSKLPVVPEVMTPYQSRDIDVETHISRNDMSKIRTLSENEVNHLIGWARNSAELDESFFRRRPVTVVPRYHVRVDAACGTDGGAGEGTTILHKNSNDSFDYGEIGAVETSVNVTYQGACNNNPASVATTTSTAVGCMHVALRDLPTNIYKLPDLPEEDELSSHGSPIYSPIHIMEHREQQPKWVEIHEVPPKGDMIVTEIVKPSAPKLPSACPNLLLVSRDFTQEGSMIRDSNLGAVLRDPALMSAYDEERLLIQTPPLRADVEQNLSILRNSTLRTDIEQERPLMPLRSEFGRERSMLRDLARMVECGQEIPKAPIFIDFEQEHSILRQPPLRADSERDPNFRSDFGPEDPMARHQPLREDFGREDLLMRDTSFGAEFRQECSMMRDPPGTASMPNLTAGLEENEYYVEDSDLEYEMLGRENYTKYCGPRPKLEEMPNMSNDSGGVPEFIEIEPKIPCMDLSFLKNASPIRYSDQIDEKEDEKSDSFSESLNLDTANSPRVSPVHTKVASKSKHNDKEGKTKRTKKSVEKDPSSNPRTKQSKTTATRKSPSSPRSPSTYRKQSSSPRQSPKLGSQRSRHSDNVDLRSAKNIVLTKSIEDLKLEKMAIFAKMRSTQERIIEMLDKLRIALLEIYVPDNSYEKSKRQKNAFEFTVRFSRNFLYPLKGMIEDLRLMTMDQLNSAASNDASQRVLAIFSLIAQSLQTYQKQLRYFLLDQVPQKLSTLMEMSLNAVNICLEKQVFDRNDTIIECLQERCTKFIGFLEDMHEDRFLAARENYRKSGYEKTQTASNYNLKMFMNDLNMYEPKLVPKSMPVGRRNSRKTPVHYKKLKTHSRQQTPNASDMVLAKHGGDAIETHIETHSACTDIVMSSSDPTEHSDKSEACPRSSQPDGPLTSGSFEDIAADASNLNKALIEALQTVTKEQVRQVLEPIMQSLGTALDKKNASKSIEEMLSAFNINLALLSEGDIRKRSDAQVNLPDCKVSGAKAGTALVNTLPNGEVLQQNVTNALKAANHTKLVMRRQQPTDESARCGSDGLAAVDYHVGDDDTNNSGHTNSDNNNDNSNEPRRSNHSAHVKKFNPDDEAASGERMLRMGLSDDGVSDDGNFHNFNVILAMKPVTSKLKREKNAAEHSHLQPLQKQLQKQQHKQQKQNQQQQQQQQQQPPIQHKRQRQQQQQQQQHQLEPQQQGKQQRKPTQQHPPLQSKPPPYRPKQKLYDEKRYSTPRPPVQAFNLYSKPAAAHEAPATHRGPRKTGGSDKFSSTCLDPPRNGNSKTKLLKKRRNPLLPPPPAPTATPSTSARERKRRARLLKPTNGMQHSPHHDVVTGVEVDLAVNDNAAESDAGQASAEKLGANYIVVSSHMSQIASQLQCELSDVFIPCTRTPFDMQQGVMKSPPTPTEQPERLTARQSRCVAEVITKCLLSLHLDAEAAKSAMMQVSNAQDNNSRTAHSNSDLGYESAWRKSQNLLHHQLLLQHQMEEKREQRLVMQAQLKQKMDEEQKRQLEMCALVDEAKRDTSVESTKELKLEQNQQEQPEQSQHPEQSEQREQSEQPEHSEQPEQSEQPQSQDPNQNRSRSGERKPHKKRAQPQQERPKAKQSKRQVLGELNTTSSEKENTNHTNGNNNMNGVNASGSNTENTIEDKLDLKIGDLLNERDEFLQQCKKNRFYSNPNYNQPWRVFSRLSTKISNEIISMIEEDFTIGVSKFVQDFLETETQI